MSEPEKFLDRWSRRKREAAEEPAADLPAPAEAKDAGKEIARIAEHGQVCIADTSKRGRRGSVRSRQPAADRIDYGRVRHPRVPRARRSAGARACGASSRLVRRSGDSRLHRPGREPVGLQRSAWRARLRPDAGGREHRQPGCAGDRHAAAGATRRAAATRARAGRQRTKLAAGCNFRAAASIAA